MRKTLRDNRGALDGSNLNLMVRSVSGGSQHGNLQTERFHAHGEDIVIIRIATQLVSHHDGLRVHVNNLFSKIMIAVLEYGQLAALVLLHLLTECLMVGALFNQSGIGIEMNRAYCHRAVVELPTLTEEL